VTNDKLFTDYATKLEAKKTEATYLQKKLCFCQVVPKGYIDEELSSFQNKVTQQLISPVASISGGSDQVVRDLQNSIQMFLSKIATKPILEVQEERQMNKYCLHPIFRDYGYKMSTNFPENKCSLFGSSKPDIMFFKTTEKEEVVAAVVGLPKQSESVEVEEHYHKAEAIEYKRTSTTKHACQCFADMIRVANDTVIESLQNGILVKSITVHGLLVSHDDLENSAPMKYYCNFNEKCAPIIQVGMDGNFVDLLLYCILQY